MIILVQIICLFVALLVTERYIVSGVKLARHRLLPMVLIVIIVYDFYQIVHTITGQDEVFFLLEDLLLIHTLYLLLYYIFDLLQIKPAIWLRIIFMISILGMNIFVMSRAMSDKKYYNIFVWFMIGYIMLILGLSTYTYMRQSLSKREYYVSNMLYLSLYVPGIVLSTKYIFGIEMEVALPVALCITCLVIYRLICQGQLVDTQSLLQENVYNTSGNAIVLLDEDLYFIGANEAARVLYPEAFEEARKKRSRYPFKNKIVELKRSGKGKAEIEYNGNYYELQMKAKEESGRTKGYIITVIDFSKQKNETKKMEALKEHAENETGIKSQFLARMSHELRSPLNSIIGISDILEKKREIKGLDKELVQHINYAGRNLLDLVNSILEYSKLETGKIELSKKEYSISQVLSELTHMGIVNLRSKPVHITSAITTKYPKTVVGDEMRVREILQNVMMNAVKYTDDGEIRCELSVVRKEENGKVLFRFVVIDTGRGMKKEFLDVAFKEYVTEEKNQDKGTGLGLTIVKQIANLLGGDVRISSEYGRGTTVEVYFYQEMAGDETEAQRVFDKEYFTRRHIGIEDDWTPNFAYPNATILVADDAKVNHMIFSAITELWNVKIDYVTNGKEAVNAVRNKEYQLIFLDYMMPVMDGFEAARRIRKITDTPMILFTANVSDMARENCEKYGFDEYLTKPIRIEKLQKVMDTYIPERFREIPEIDFSMSVHYNSLQAKKSYRRTYEAFVTEIKPLVDSLYKYIDSDLVFFRGKIHGIKGVSRQLGFERLGELSEIMEMAAKTGNIEFIKRHYIAFKNEMNEVLEEVENDLSTIPEDVGEVKGSTKELNEVLKELKSAFDEYDIKGIESCIDVMSGMELTGQEKKMYEQLKIWGMELEYEKGSDLLSDYGV